jgi:hypothetical protein
MYIRRKVFSLLQDETGEERYYSTTDFDLDVEERVFAEAEEEPKKLSKGAKIGIGVGGGLAATAAGIVGAKYAGKALLKKGAKIAEQAEKAAKAAKAAKNKEGYIYGTLSRTSLSKLPEEARKPMVEEARKLTKTAEKNAKKAEKLAKSAEWRNKTGEILSAPADFVVDKTGKVWKFLGDKAASVKEKTTKAYKNAKAPWYLKKD